MMNRWVRRAGAWLGVGLILAGSVCCLNDLFWQHDEWSRVMFHSFYSQKENIDNVFIGSSHVFCDIDPFMLDEINDENNFNLATSGLQLNAAYYLLKEADSRHTLSRAVIELYYALNMDYSECGINEWRVTDYMKWSLNKVRAIGDLEITKLPESLFPFMRFRGYLDDYEYMHETAAQKKDDAYRSCRYITADGNGITEYREKGYWYSTSTLESRIYKRRLAIQEDSFGAEAERYLRKIIEYCRQNGIEIYLTVNPIYELEVLSVEDYDAYYRRIDSIAKEYDVPFYDFNLCKKEYCDIQHPEYFKDTGHMNVYGVELFTPFLWSVLTGDEADNKKYFYGTYDEKLRSAEPEIYGLYYHEENGENIYTVAGNREDGMEYRIILTSETQDGQTEQRMLQDFYTNKTFAVPSDEHGICTVVARMSDDPDNVQCLEVQY